MEKVRWGILGCADIVERRILPAMELLENGELGALATRGPSERLDRLQARHGPFPVVYGYDELLADPHIQAVYIPLPNALHVEWSLKAAQAGKHVLCEKPIACRSADLLRLQEAAAQHRVHIMEAFACVHSPLFATVLGLIDAGEIGELRSVESVFSSPASRPGGISTSREAMGGAIHDVGCYTILNIRRLSRREPLAAQAYGSFFPNGADASVYSLLDLGDGVVGCSRCSKDAVNNRGFTVCGSEGLISFDKTSNTWGTLELLVANPRHQKTVTLEVSNPYTAEMAQMGRCILEGETPLLSLEESQKNIRVMEMLHQAIGSWMAR